MTKLRAGVCTTAAALADLTTAVCKPMGTAVRLPKFSAITGVFWHDANMKITAARAGPGIFLATGITACLLDPLVDALQVEGFPTLVAGPDLGATCYSADADRAIVNPLAELVCKLLGQRSHFNSGNARVLVASAPACALSSSLALTTIFPLPLLLAGNRLQNSGDIFGGLLRWTNRVSA